MELSGGKLIQSTILVTNRATELGYRHRVAVDQGIHALELVIAIHQVALAHTAANTEVIGNVVAELVAEVI